MAIIAANLVQKQIILKWSAQFSLTQSGHKGKHPKSGGERREITCWHQAEESDAKSEDSDAWCQQVISRLAPQDERVFSFYTVLTYGINNKFTYYVIHHAVPRGGGSHSFLRDTLSSTL